MILRKNANLIIATGVVITINYIIGAILGSSIFLIGMMLFGLLLLSLKCDGDTLNYFMVCTVLQNFVLVICSSYMNGTETQLIILLKELIVYACGAIYFVKHRLTRVELTDCIFVLFIFYSLFNIAALSPSFGSGIIGFRQLLVIFMCFYFGRAIKLNSEEQISVILQYIVGAAIIISVVGFIIMLIPGNVWENIGYGKYWYNKTGTTNYSYINFYTWDFGKELKRFVSIFADPLACAHFLGIAFVIMFIQTKRRILQKLIVVLALIFGMSKASVVLIVCIIGVKNYSKIKSSFMRGIFIFLLACMGGLGIVYLSRYTSSLQRATSIGNHFSAFLYGINNISLLGSGYGSTGYNAIMMGAEVNSKFGESFFATCIGQIGILGTSLLYFFIIIIGIDIFKRYRYYSRECDLISLILIVSVTLESLFSASAISMLGTGFYFILAGISAGFGERRKELCVHTHFTFKI